MGNKPWFTSQDLIDAVKRKIAIPINQRTFTEEDILAFANEEMVISQVPDIMIYHEEYFVATLDVPLISNVTRYPIPERAMGGKLRDVFYKDINDNLFEMTRVPPEDKAYWQRESGSSSLMQKYFLENNDVVLAPQNMNNPTGSLQFSYFLRPNLLVKNDRAAICSNFFKNVVVDNGSIVAGNTLTVGSVVFTAVVGAPSALEFQIGANSIATASNLVTAINTNATYTATNGSPSTSTVTINLLQSDVDVQSNNNSALSVDSRLGIQFTDLVPSNIVDGINVDFLQTKPGHKSLKLSYQLPIGSVSDSAILIPSEIIPDDFIVGDYICEEYECIIPQIPSDLHNGLAERVCGRILAAQGDMAGLQMVGAKLNEIKTAEGALLDNRVVGSTQKITQRRSPLAWLKMGVRRRV